MAQARGPDGRFIPGGSGGAATNIDDVNAKLANLKLSGQVLETAVRAGLLPIETRAKAVVHKITTNLARSIHIETQSDGQSASGRVGTNVEYAIIEELRDGGGHAYLRPSFDAEQDTAVSEVRAVLADQVRQQANER